jgi:proline racemase
MLGIAASYTVIDSHTAGHPTRVILSGLPPLRGETLLEIRDYFRIEHDDLRPRLLHEPVGHAAMVGLVSTPSRVADYGALPQRELWGLAPGWGKTNPDAKGFRG